MNYKYSEYKGFEFRANGNVIEGRRKVSAVHGGYPSPYKVIASNVESPEQASKEIEDFVASAS